MEFSTELIKEKKNNQINKEEEEDMDKDKESGQENHKIILFIKGIN